jgi:hypothetical protein
MQSFLSVVKIIISVLLVGVFAVLLYSYFTTPKFSRDTLIVFFVTSIMLVLYAGYMMYSGITGFKEFRINSVILWLGSIYGLGLFTYSFFFTAMQTSTLVMGIIVVVVSVHDITRALKKPAKPQEIL